MLSCSSLLSKPLHNTAYQRCRPIRLSGTQNLKFKYKYKYFKLVLDTRVQVQVYQVLHLCSIYLGKLVYYMNGSAVNRNRRLASNPAVLCMFCGEPAILRHNFDCRMTRVTIQTSLQALSHVNKHRS